MAFVSEATFMWPVMEKGFCNLAVTISCKCIMARSESIIVLQLCFLHAQDAFSAVVNLVVFHLYFFVLSVVLVMIFLVIYL